MNPEDIWRRIQEGEGQSSAPGLLVRRIDPESSDDLFAGIRTSARTRFLLLRLPSEPRLSRNALFQSRGFRTALTRFDGDPPGSASLMIESSDPSFNDMFGVLSGEIIDSIAVRPAGEPSLSAFVVCLQRWKRFFDSTGTDGLGDEALLGLFAELLFLKDFVFAHFSNTLGAVSAWVGPDPLSKDFQLSACAVEVKCSATREHTKVHISGERQLDARGLPPLYLFVLLVERVAAGGTTVPGLVDEVRTYLGNSPARAIFEEKLMASGYHDAQRSRYVDRLLLIQSHRIYRVRDAFPKLVAPLPSGVGDLSYTLALSACAPFAIEDSEIVRLLGESTSAYDF